MPHPAFANHVPMLIHPHLARHIMSNPQMAPYAIHPDDGSIEPAFLPGASDIVPQAPQQPQVPGNPNVQVGGGGGPNFGYVGTGGVGNFGSQFSGPMGGYIPQGVPLNPHAGPTNTPARWDVWGVPYAQNPGPNMGQGYTPYGTNAPYGQGGEFGQGNLGNDPSGGVSEFNSDPNPRTGAHV